MPLHLFSLILISLHFDDFLVFFVIFLHFANSLQILAHFLHFQELGSFLTPPPWDHPLHWIKRYADKPRRVSFEVFLSLWGLSLLELRLAVVIGKCIYAVSFELAICIQSLCKDVPLQIVHQLLGSCSFFQPLWSTLPLWRFIYLIS